MRWSRISSLSKNIATLWKRYVRVRALSSSYSNPDRDLERFTTRSPKEGDEQDEEASSSIVCTCQRLNVMSSLWCVSVCPPLFSFLRRTKRRRHPFACLPSSLPAPSESTGLSGFHLLGRRLSFERHVHSCGKQQHADTEEGTGQTDQVDEGTNLHDAQHEPSPVLDGHNRKPQARCGRSGIG